VACAIAAPAIAGLASANSPAIDTAKSQAEALRAQIDVLDAQVEAAVETYDTATAKLDETEAAAADNGHKLAAAQADLQPGDLVFFFDPVHHVGIYIGSGQMVDAAGTGKGVRIDYLWSSYNCARRILQ